MYKRFLTYYNKYILNIIVFKKLDKVIKNIETSTTSRLLLSKLLSFYLG